MTITRTFALLASLFSTASLAAPTIEGCPVFPANNYWNARVDHLPVHSLSNAWVANVRSAGDGATRPFHMDFGSGLYEGSPIGIPYVVVNGSQPTVPVTFDYWDESDRPGAVGNSPIGQYPIPPNAPIEGVPPTNADGDRHVLVIDKDNCILYETFYSFPQNGGASWTAGSGAIYQLNANVPLRPSGWTSADAAGLPIFPGLARYEEVVAAGGIQHALRFTASQTQRAFIWPARHQAGHTNNTNVAPMGARFRLKASYDISGFSPQARAIAQAMKTYGIVLADNGSPWYVSGIPNAGWDNDALHELDVLRGSHFEAVDTSALMVDANSAQAAVAMYTLTVGTSGAGVSASPAVTSSPSQIVCGGDPIPPGAICIGSFIEGTMVTLTAHKGTAAFAGWYGDCSGTGTCTVTMSAARNVVAVFVPPSEKLVVGRPNGTCFPGQSMGTTSQGSVYTVANVGTTTRNVSSVTTPGGGPFVFTHDCATVAPGASCLIIPRFSPPPTAGALNSTADYAAQITIVSDSATAVPPIQLCGTAEKSLVSHYYRSILGREPEGSGKTFWEGEAARLSGLGASVNETWFVMAGYFFNSPEYLAANKSNALFVGDLYLTFFNRAADLNGLTYWTNQIASGLPREVVLFSFMFSSEFATSTQNIFGNTTVRPEINVVMDFFRGILNRLPDSTAYGYWVNQLRIAQCAGAGAVYAKVNEISASFIFNPEYNNRARNNTQFVTDMYYSFLRRGGDTTGVNFWINQLNTGGKDRNTVRTDFLASPEFGSRVQAVINAGCAL